jgi:hypothetical protein
MQTRRCAGALGSTPTMECPGFGTCSLSITTLHVGAGNNCSGCNFLGTATLTCQGINISENFSMAAACGGSNFKLVNCPSGEDGGYVSIACSQCPGD